MNEAAYRAAEGRLWASLGIEPRERTLDLPRHGARVRVQELGEGPPVLFIHGANTTGASWAGLAARMAGFRCLIVDRPGTGLSPPIPGRVDARSLPEIADTIVADILDALELPFAHLVATSLGGYVALRAAAATPERVDRMVQLSWPVGAPSPRLPLFLRAMCIPGFGRLVASMPANERSVRALFRRMGNGPNIDAGRISPEDLGAYLALIQHTDTVRNEIAAARTVISPIHGLAGLELVDELLGRVRCPTLFVWGGRDPFGDAETARRFVARIPAATLDLWPAAGHSPWMDDPEGCARAVASFLRGAGQPSGPSPGQDPPASSRNQGPIPEARSTATRVT